MEVFRAVMITGSIKGASQLLFTSQPAVSRVISHTEQTLGLALFNRVKGKLVPTPEAEALFQEVDKCFAYAERVDHFARNLAQGSTGTLNIASSPCLAKTLMAKAVTVFVQRYPKVRVNYHVTLLNDVSQEVLSNKVDLAVCVLPPQHPNLVTQAFLKGRMVCIAPKGHPLAATGRPIRLEDIKDYPLVAHDPAIPFGQIVSSALRRAAVEPTIRISIQQTEVACALVKAGAGVAIVDQYTVEGLGLDEFEVLELEQQIPLTPSVVRSAFDARATHADKFIEVLLELADTSAGEPLSVVAVA